MKILLAAIAKNEGAYLPEWINHHLFMGFDGIEIYINGTTDKSISILDKIKDKYSNVNYTICDYLLSESYQTKNTKLKDCTDLQILAYDEIINKYKKEYSHISFLDLDEYFIAKDNEKVQDLLNEIESDAIAIKWLEKKGSNKTFNPSVESTMIGYKCNTVKAIFKIPNNVEDVSIHAHFPKINNGIHYLYGFGHVSHVRTNYKQKTNEDNFFILHEKNRSKEEYLAKVFNGNDKNILSDKSSKYGLKINRRGWNMEKYNLTYTISEEVINELNLNLEQMIFECNLEQDIKDCQEMFLNGYKQVTPVIEKELFLFQKMIKSLRNTGEIRYSPLIRLLLKNAISEFFSSKK